MIASRDAHVSFGGTRDGTALVVFEVFPQLSFTTDEERLLGERELYLLGTAHRHCTDRARQRLERQEVKLPDDLPLLLIDQPEELPPSLDRPPTGETCPFCGTGQGMTEEHVWPKWISRLLREHGTFRIKTDGRTRTAQMLNITAPICQDCNTRWLATLENDVRPILGPMILGEVRKLWANEQERLAAWAAKTAFMIDLAHRGQSMIPEGFYRELRLQRTALPSHVVFVGAYGGSQWAAWAQGSGMYVGGSEEEAPSGFAITFTVFRVVFQVIGHFTSGGAEFNDGRWQYEPAIERIWPRWRLPVEWPKSHYAFYDRSLAEFAESVNAKLASTE